MLTALWYFLWNEIVIFFSMLKIKDVTYITVSVCKNYPTLREKTVFVFYCISIVKWTKCNSIRIVQCPWQYHYFYYFGRGGGGVPQLGPLLGYLIICLITPNYCKNRNAILFHFKLWKTLNYVFPVLPENS